MWQKLFQYHRGGEERRRLGITSCYWLFPNPKEKGSELFDYNNRTNVQQDVTGTIPTNLWTILYDVELRKRSEKNWKISSWRETKPGSIQRVRCVKRLRNEPRISTNYEMVMEEIRSGSSTAGPSTLPIERQTWVDLIRNVSICNKTTTPKSLSCNVCHEDLK